MAHRWDNFDDAFDYYSGKFANLKTAYAAIVTNMNLAHTGCPDPVDRTHFYHMYAAISYIQGFLTTLTGHTWPDWQGSGLFECLYWLDQEHGGGDPYELTLVKMIEAYIAADDDHRSAQRLLFDAYQASMYDKPFDQEYHNSWVQRFRSWA